MSMEAGVRVCLRNIYVFASEFPALSNLLRFPDPLRPYCAPQHADTRPPDTLSLARPETFPNQTIEPPERL